MKSIVSWLFRFLVFFCLPLHAQEVSYARSIVKKLTRPSFNGRGYYKNGDQKAGKWIAKEMDQLKLKTVNSTRLQSFTVPVVKFEGNVKLKINNTSLIPGKEFLVHADCIPLKRKNIHALFIPLHILQDSSKLKSIFDTLNISDYAIVIDTLPAPKKRAIISSLFRYTSTHAPLAFIYLVNSLPPWWASPYLMSVPGFYALHHDEWKVPSSKITFETGSSYDENHLAYNVVGMVEGMENSDSFLIVTAHYDHLGKMGRKALFPGANDNAAGVAMMLDLAKYYQKNPPRYSIIFMAFAAEEIGLLGSEFYTINPLHPLNKTRFLLNLDLVATGETGMTVVNGALFSEEFEILCTLNDSLQLLPSITKLGTAKNSDHFYFTELNIPSFFCYLSGPRKAYHSVDDVYDTIAFSKYTETFTLFREFFSKLQQ